MFAKIGPGTKRNTPESKTIHENSDQILALDVLLYVQIKILFATTILALRLFEVHCNAVITRVTGAIKSNRVISDTAL